MANSRLIGGWFPRPASPRAVWGDVCALISAKGRYKLVFLTMAIGITSSIITIFILEGRDPALLPGPQTIYVSDWKLTRTDAEIQAQQKIDMKALKEAREARRLQFKKVDDDLKRLGI